MLHAPGEARRFIPALAASISREYAYGHIDVFTGSAKGWYLGPQRSTRPELARGRPSLSISARGCVAHRRRTRRETGRERERDGGAGLHNFGPRGLTETAADMQGVELCRVGGVQGLTNARRRRSGDFPSSDNKVSAVFSDHRPMTGEAVACDGRRTSQRLHE